MNTHHAMLLPLGRPPGARRTSPSQGHGQSPLKLIYALWGAATGAPNAIAGLDKQLRDRIEAYAIIARAPDGSVEIRARHDRVGFSAPSVEASQAIDRVVALQPGESALLLMAPRPPLPELRRSLGMDPGDAEVVEVEVRS